jgi:hypothetical protein
LKDGGLLAGEEMSPHSTGMKMTEKVSEQQKKAMVLFPMLGGLILHSSHLACIQDRMFSKK